VIEAISCTDADDKLLPAALGYALGVLERLLGRTRTPMAGSRVPLNQAPRRAPSAQGLRQTQPIRHRALRLWRKVSDPSRFSCRLVAGGVTGWCAWLLSVVGLFVFLWGVVPVQAAVKPIVVVPVDIFEGEPFHVGLAV
jgi:hypothetical protein